MVKRRYSVSKTIANLLLLLPSVLSLFGNLTALIKVEAGAAGKRLTVLVVLAIMIAFLLVSSWLCLLGLLFVYLTTSLHLTMTMCILTILAANILLLFIVSMVAVRVKNNLLHPFSDQ